MRSAAASWSFVRSPSASSCCCSGREHRDGSIDNFFISNPVDVGTRLAGWVKDGSLFVHIWATVYATVMGFIVGSVGGILLGVWLGVSPFTSF